MQLNKEDFGDEFVWGVSTAAYQIEGGYNQHSKGLSIWDVFVQKKNKIFQNQHGNIACDFYNRYKKDLYLMSQLNIPNHRFSVSWSRILPDGIGKLNNEGIDFYNRLIDFSLELGITPWITLYHWDLPFELEKKGGWVNRDIIEWFGNYVFICVKHFGDRVNSWIVLNEPMVFCGAGYFMGVHAPGKMGLNNFLAATHYAVLAQSHGARIIKSMQKDSMVGTTFSCSHIQPFHTTKADILAASRVDTLLNRLFIEPLLGMGYPSKDLAVLNRIEKYMKQNDELDMAFKMDFIGLQNYTREMVGYSAIIPFIHAKVIKADKRKVATTLMNWEVFPESIYFILKKFGAYENIPPLLITENGAAFEDVVLMEKVNDQRRLDYLRDNLSQVYRAKEEGVNVIGYFVWTFLDNFEWAEGYYPRFGLIHVDFETQKRIVKSSGHWYSDFLS